MPPESLGDISITKILAGVAGSLVSINFLQGTPAQRITLAIGGAAMSYFFSTPVASYLRMVDAEGMIGFLIGMFGMAIASKFYEVIAAMDAKALAADVWAWVKRKWGA